MNTPNTAHTSTTAPAKTAPSRPSARVSRVLSGRVTSTKMQKTVTVEVSRRVKHEIYGKYINRSKKYHAHVEGMALNDGDMVEIQECRPYSATKTWRVTRKLSGVGGR